MDQPKQVVWKESSTIMFVVPTNKSTNSHSDFEVLMLKRSERTALSANHAVFPGGIIESEADESIDWMRYFEEFGIEQAALKQLIILDENRPRILAPRGGGCYDRFFKQSIIWAREISLRINAIREAFEEVGVLLCRSKVAVGHPIEMGSGNYRSDFDVTGWQKRVHNDARQFIQLCRQLNVVPDLWALIEWGSVWATPAVMPKRRYEAANFIAFLQEKPKLTIEESEVQGCLWESPTSILKMFQRGELWLMPPQFYEVSRLASSGSYEELQKLMYQRHAQGKGCRLHLPVVCLCTDGMVGVLPGDDFYVSEPYNSTKPIEIKSTIAEFRSITKNIHRMENSGMPSMRIYLNFDLPDKHLRPVSIVPQSKL